MRRVDSIFHTASIVLWTSLGIGRFCVWPESGSEWPRPGRLEYELKGTAGYYQRNGGRLPAFQQGFDGQSSGRCAAIRELQSGATWVLIAEAAANLLR